MTYIKRKKALEAMLQQKMTDLQQLETARNTTVTEIVELRGKLQLLNELELESSNKEEPETEASEEVAATEETTKEE